MPIDWFPLWLSLRVAALATGISLVLGLWVAYLLVNVPFRGRAWMDAASTLPLVLPPTVLGYYLLVLLGQDSPLGRLYEALTGHPLLFTWQAAVIAAVIHTFPLVVILARAAFERVDADHERAARLLGASEWRIFRKVTLPLSGRAIVVAVALAFARALCDFGITLMIAGNAAGRTQTLSVAVYDAVTNDRGAAARALVVVASLVALAILALANRITLRRGWQ